MSRDHHVYCMHSPPCTQLLMQMADDFIESVVTSACKLARHRKSSTLAASDLQLHLGEVTSDEGHSE